MYTLLFRINRDVVIVRFFFKYKDKEFFFFYRVPPVLLYIGIIYSSSEWLHIIRKATFVMIRIQWQTFKFCEFHTGAKHVLGPNSCIGLVLQDAYILF